MPSVRDLFLAAAGVALFLPEGAGAQTLRGSLASVERQYSVAVSHDYTFLQTPAQVRRFVSAGYLVPITESANVQLVAVSYPYGRPALRTFVQRLSAQHRAACGDPLVVTSLTRPANEQPRNASDESVHPAGMAVDLRISQKPSCRKWLEKTLLSLEKRGLIEATKERNPAHFHVAVFPTAYMEYVESVTGAKKAAVADDETGVVKGN
jgi:hypothetical protein